MGALDHLWLHFTEMGKYEAGEEMGEAAAAPSRSIEPAAEVAALTRGNLNRVFFVSGGSEAVEAAWKLARQYHTACRGRPRAARSPSIGAAHVQISPPLVASQAEFDTIAGTLGKVLEEAGRRMQVAA